MRTTLNIKHSTPDELAKHLRSLASKIDAGELTSGADFTVGNARVQVAEQQVSDIRAWARENAEKLAAKGITVGGRGRYSKALQDEYAKYLARVQRGKEAAAKRRADRVAEEAVSA